MMLHYSKVRKKTHQFNSPSCHALGGDPTHPLSHKLGLSRLHVPAQLGSTCRHLQHRHNTLAQLVEQVEQILAGWLQRKPTELPKVVINSNENMCIWVSAVRDATWQRCSRSTSESAVTSHKALHGCRDHLVQPCRVKIKADDSSRRGWGVLMQEMIGIG